MGEPRGVDRSEPPADGDPSDEAAPPDDELVAADFTPDAALAELGDEVARRPVRRGGRGGADLFGIRVLAASLDVVALVCLLLVAFAIARHARGISWRHAEAMATAVVLMCYTLCDVLWSATPGRWVCGLAVTQPGGTSAAFVQRLLRWALRHPYTIFLPAAGDPVLWVALAIWYTVNLIAIGASRDGLGVWDTLAGTVITEYGRRGPPRHRPERRGFEPVVRDRDARG
jgi:uncharacterized RDD family membrane protein YckC